MITLLEELVDRADGTYANAKDLRALEHIMSSWSERKEAYLAIQAKEELILDRAIELMEKDHPTHEKRTNNSGVDCCRRDLALTLRSYALGMLLQDEEMLKDRMLYWQKSIFQAMDLSKYQGFKYLLESLYLELSVAQADLCKPYFNIARDIILSN